MTQELHLKTIFLKATFMSALVGLSAGEAFAADYKKNPFTLAYDGVLCQDFVIDSSGVAHPFGT
ncbi:hydrolase of the alpha beta superfamily protein [Pseudomonas syringae pv. actinidiae ICMP 18804]|uniref:Hydrolase of the alpha beta superfamily protein n=1 Tax=Pseudomonas syringae pv. actinidiae ICMP 18807 TaxID=1194404 RepID=S6V6L0_PSESF|nr:hydrolase of the alpha beta superfamily protein [Pseudomonas syringae pv. actinidiae ICMP 18804]EPN41813.1 hydrolase of the alpha beta superfamily protein [Pseudomonas syringae pv. actinidiae ICMP 19095]EPN46740.1 hydrolase of the alpha beta superfamily protein [Pseudomonas syringae pv. actinidiae ICMP 18807]KTC50145.1 hypothetical protein AO250_10440 [Pseudomonas syringae pv. actinidiae ICMP 19497]NAT17429.1 hypothetical protein [Pseudomonas syringae pv. actinidifoliorum]